MKFRRIFFTAITIKVIVVSTLFGGIASLLPTDPASAHHNLNGSACYFTPKGPPNTTNEEGTGYMFRTVGVYAGHDASVKGRTVHSTCAFTRDDLRYNWLLPDKVWLGPRGVTAAGAVYDGSGPYAEVQNDSTVGGSGCAPGCGVSRTTNGNYIVAQDDTTMISYEGNIVHCIAFRGANLATGGPSCNPLNGDDIYIQGVSPNAQTTSSPNHNCAWAGWGSNCYNNNGASGFQALSASGFLNLPNSETPAQVNARERTAQTSSSQGFLSTIDIEMWYRNTYSGGYGSELVLTFRYPQRNSDCTLAGNTVDLGNIVAGSSQNPTITFKNIGREDWRHDWSNANDPRKTSPTGSSTTVRETTSNSFAPNQITLPSGNQLITGNTAAPSATNNGESISFNIPFIAPTTTGSYTIDYQMHIIAGTGSTGIRPIGEKCSITFNITEPGPGDITCSTSSIAIEEQTSSPITLGVTFNPVLAIIPINGSIVITNSGGLTISPNGSITYNSGAPPTTSASRGFTVSPAPAGAYSITYVFDSDSTAPVTCPVTIRVTKRPYVKIFGNDVFAGGGFGNGCTATAGEINANYDQATGRGSGTQLAAFALGDINNFATAINRSVNPIRPDGLSFANNTSPPGNFGGNNCVIGYELPSPMPASNVPGNDITSWPAAVSAFYNTGLTTIRASGPVPTGRRVIVYVSGNIKITENIEYNTAAPWNSADDIPSITVVASGDIYIDNSVTQIDGTYVAHGTIYTCYNSASNSFWAISELHNNCGNQLTVFGSLIANDIKWLRTYGSTLLSNSGESPFNIFGPPVNSSELVISGPEIYAALCAAGPTCNIGNNSTSGTYDSITSLPPIL